MSPRAKIRAFCDGSCVNGTLSAMGYASIIKCLGDHGYEIVVSLAFHVAPLESNTNNIAEIYAALSAITAVDPDLALREGMSVCSDSLYVINQAQGLWSINKNHREIQILQIESKKRGITWEHVRGHTGHLENEQCDVLAGAARMWTPPSPLLPGTSRIVTFEMEMVWPEPGRERTTVLSLEKGILTNTIIQEGGERWKVSIPPGYLP